MVPIIVDSHNLTSRNALGGPPAALANEVQGGSGLAICSYLRLLSISPFPKTVSDSGQLCKAIPRG